MLLLACRLPFPLLIEARGAPRLPGSRSNGAQAGPGGSGWPGVLLLLLALAGVLLPHNGRGQDEDVQHLH